MFLINGNDDYLINLKVKKIIKDTNSDYLVLDAETCDFSEAEDYISTPPFLEDKKTLIINNTFHFSRMRVKNDKFTEEQLLQLIDGDYENEIIFTLSKGKLDENKKIFKNNKDKFQTIKIEDLNDASFRSFANTLTTKRDIDIDSNAFNYLIEASDMKAEQLVNNIKKLELVKAPINISNIDKLVTKNTSYIAFNLTNYIFKGDVEKAIEIKESLINAGESDIAIIGLIASNMRTILKIKLGEENSLSPKNIGDIAKINSYSIKLNVDIAYSMELETIKSTINKLFEFDVMLKSSSEYNDSLLDLLIVDLCNEVR